MKMKPEHLAHIKASVSKLDTEFHRSRYQASGLSTKRYQWDMVRAAELMPWVCNTLYAYLDDQHIQTALNRAIKPLA